MGFLLTLIKLFKKFKWTRNYVPSLTLYSPIFTTEAQLNDRND